MNDPGRHLVTLFTAARAHPAGPERDAYLDRACAGDPGARAELEALLAAHEQAGGFLESPTTRGRPRPRASPRPPPRWHPPTRGYRLRKLVRRNRAGVLLSGGLALLAAAVAVGGRMYAEAAREAERRREESDQARRVREAHEKIPLVQAALRRGRYEKAFDLLKEVEPVIPDHPDLPELWEECSHTCTPTTAPPSADVWLRPYDQPDAPWRHVIRTTDKPVAVRIPRGEYLWRATKAGYREVTGLRPPQAAGFSLDPEDAIPREMVRIPPGRPDRPGMALATEFRSVELPAFLIDRYEATNAEYDRFVRDGGYDRPDYWRDLPWIDGDGKPTTWESVKALLVDQTGRPGPATWRDGRFPPGEGDHPVRGVSWYEATAYARFVGKSLPTIDHWVQAGQIESSVVLAGNDLITRSNFGPRVRPVRSLGDHGFHGTRGMMGNVKEWCVNDTGDGQRFILGGGCGEPIYMPLTLDSSPPLRRGEFFGFRCVKFLNMEKGPAAARRRPGASRGRPSPNERTCWTPPRSGSRSRTDSSTTATLRSTQPPSRPTRGSGSTSPPGSTPPTATRRAGGSG